MLITKIKIVAAMMLAVALLAGGMRAAGTFGQTQARDQSTATSAGEVTDDAESIQGDWYVIAAANNGEELLKSSIENLRLIVTNKRMTLMNGESTEFDATYKLDPSSAPKRIDLTDTKSSRTVKGIYVWTATT